MISIANPIYDAVFKYLVEDERIARTLLSALLKKDIVAVEMRPHEYSNETKDHQVSMFRIDFAATVRQPDGREELILVELQKTWVETETLRFRRYLGAQYNNKHNMQQDGRGDYALPTVAVYLLGHRVGDIEEPVVYCRHKVYDYNGREVTVGVPDPFVESLTHDSIIVQIPLLRGQVNNRLDEVLSVFDQSRADKVDKQILRLDNDAYEGNDDMEYILHRLTLAAADARMREDMNVEDEYYSVIENRDTAIMDRDKKIKELDGRITKQEQQLSQQEQQLSQQERQLSQQEQQLSQQEQQLSQQEQQLSQQEQQLSQQEQQLSQQEQQLSQQEQQLSQQEQQLSQQEQQLSQKDALLRAMVKGMMASGMSVEDIARLTGKNPGEIRQCLDDESA